MAGVLSNAAKNQEFATNFIKKFILNGQRGNRFFSTSTTEHQTIYQQEHSKYLELTTTPTPKSNPAPKNKVFEPHPKNPDEIIESYGMSNSRNIKNTTDLHPDSHAQRYGLASRPHAFSTQAHSTQAQKKPVTANPFNNFAAEFPKLSTNARQVLNILGTSQIR